ncbi:MAG: galactose mutarotase [Nocardioides sp.]|nr:galactose mutarotase [Nocardioides sp.]
MILDGFGTLEDGSVVHRLVLGSAPGPVLHLLTLGATVHRLEVTGGDGVRRNLALGHATPADYLASTYYIGGTIGRYANRIAGGRFPLQGREVRVGAHDRGNHLHGGPDGFDRRRWRVLEHSPDHAVLGLESPDGDQGFPGAVSARARFELTGDPKQVGGTVSLVLTATTDALTPVNLTSHAYLNLDGDGAGSIDEHLLQVEADHYTPVDDTGIPVAGHAPVAGTAFDFREPARIGPAVRSGQEQVAAARGIDHNYVLRGGAGPGLHPAAVLTSPRTRTRLELRTDQPGLQVYTGNFLDGGHRSAQGRLYRQGDGIALEPQLFPDSPHHPEWPSALLAPGETYRAELVWRFTGTP